MMVFPWLLMMLFRVLLAMFPHHQGLFPVLQVLFPGLLVLELHLLHEFLALEKLVGAAPAVQLVSMGLNVSIRTK